VVEHGRAQVDEVAAGVGAELGPGQAGHRVGGGQHDREAETAFARPRRLRVGSGARAPSENDDAPEREEGAKEEARRPPRVQNGHGGPKEAQHGGELGGAKAVQGRADYIGSLSN
jgi:hypothetical protein